MNQKDKISKRTVTRPGDVFCVEIDEKHKCYFQYLEKNPNNLYSAVIRVFEKRYCVDDNPQIETILRDGILFYAHVFLQLGLQDKVWYKVGHSSNVGDGSHKNIIFFNYGGKNTDMFFGLEYYFTLNDGMTIGGSISAIDVANAEICSVFSPDQIRDRMKYGYYTTTQDEYDIISRLPRSDVDSYTRKVGNMGKIIYFHFHGSYVVEQVVQIRGKIIRLTVRKPRQGVFKLYKKDFGAINWRYDEFISKIDFKRAWDGEPIAASTCKNTYIRNHLLYKIFFPVFVIYGLFNMTFAKIKAVITRVTSN